MWKASVVKARQGPQHFPLQQFLEMMSLFIKKKKKREMCLRPRLNWRENKRGRWKVEEIQEKGRDVEMKTDQYKRTTRGVESGHK